MIAVRDPEQIGCRRFGRFPPSSDYVNGKDVCPGPECSAFLECLEETLWYLNRKLADAKKLEAASETEAERREASGKIAEILGNIEYLSMQGPLKFADEGASGLAELRNETEEIRNRLREMYSEAEGSTEGVKPKKVLVVDDESSIRELVSEILESQGFDVETAPNGLVALQFLNRGNHDLALVDLRMPGVDGIEFIKRAKENHPDTEFVILTGYASLESAIDAVNLGVSAYMQKPLLSPDELISTVKRVLKME